MPWRVASGGTVGGGGDGCGKRSEAAGAVFFMRSSATKLMQMQQRDTASFTGTRRSFNYHPALLRVGLSKAMVTLPVRAVTAHPGSPRYLHFMLFWEHPPFSVGPFVAARMCAPARDACLGCLEWHP